MARWRDTMFTTIYPRPTLSSRNYWLLTITSRSIMSALLTSSTPIAQGAEAASQLLSCFLQWNLISMIESVQRMSDSRWATSAVEVSIPQTVSTSKSRCYANMVACSGRGASTVKMSPVCVVVDMGRDYNKMV